MQKIDSHRHSERFPYWLRQSIRLDDCVKETRRVLSGLRLRTVCQSARCPNMHDCFSKKRCTFLILGNLCTRRCNFCSIQSRKENLGLPDREGLLNICRAVEMLGLTNVVITSVTRDDLDDGGAWYFAECVELLQGLNIDLHIEVLVPDFMGNVESIKQVISAGPDVFAHNIETVPRLYNKVRPEADYQRSLSVLKTAKDLNNRCMTKSGIMAGLGETREEIYSIMEDLRAVRCDVITVGQYLRPDSSCLEVEEFLSPDEFDLFSRWARGLGFKEYLCGPFVRSSYQSWFFRKMNET